MNPAGVHSSGDISWRIWGWGWEVSSTQCWAQSDTAKSSKKRKINWRGFGARFPWHEGTARSSGHCCHPSVLLSYPGTPLTWAGTRTRQCQSRTSGTKEMTKNVESSDKIVTELREERLINTLDPHPTLSSRQRAEMWGITHGAPQRPAPSPSSQSLPSRNDHSNGHLSFSYKQQ